MIAERMKIVNKKGRPTKNQCYENGDSKKQNDKKKQKRRKKKAFEEAQDEVVKQISEGAEKDEQKHDALTSEHEELLQFVNSNFGARVKRRCVLQNEAKSKESWWSDENDGMSDDEEEEEIIDDESDVVKENEQIIEKAKTPSVTKREVRKRRKGGGGRQSNKQRKENGTVGHAVSTEQTIHCYVFSTGMANRAGHAVNKGIYKSISDYHHCQKWETPYLIPEVHCRPFYPELEKIEKEECKDKETCSDSATSVACDEIPRKENNTNIDTATVKTEVEKEETNRVMSPLHPRNNLIHATQNSGNESHESSSKIHEIERPNLESNPKDEKEFAPSPPKIPKSENETSNIKNEERLIPREVPATCISQPPPLTSLSSTKVISYPADISKDLFKYQSPVTDRPNVVSEKSPDYKNETLTRPSVLNMAIERKPPTDVRSSIDIAEKVLKESRSNYSSVPSTMSPQMPPFSLKTSTVPIFPRDVHPSVFMSMHSPHLRQDARYRAPNFQGHDLKPHPNDSLFSASSRHKSPFTPPPMSHPHMNSSFHSPRNEIPHSMYSSRDPAQIFSRHKPSSPLSFPKSESKFCEPYKPLSSSLKNGIVERPSSLPVPTNRVEKHPPKSFSVESLTKPSLEKHIDSMTIPNVICEKSSRMAERPLHFLQEQEQLLRERHRIPNGMNGLKRSLDERLSNHMRERMHENSLSPFFEKFHDERYLAAAALAERERIENERLSSDKEHFLHRTRLPYPGHSIRHGTETTHSSIMAPPLPTFMKGSRNGIEPPSSSYSPYLRMGLSFAPPPFSHR